jgi:tetratricopeptide (TPR) repeat protein
VDEKPVTPDDVRSLIRAGHQSRREGRTEDSKRSFQLAAELCAPGTQERAYALAGLAQIERDLAHDKAALAFYEQALHIHRSNGDLLHAAHTVRHIADIYRHDRNPEEARHRYDEALALYRKYPDPPPLDLANALRGLAILKEQTGNPEESAVLWREARELYAAAGVKLPSSEGNPTGNSM